MKLKAPILPTYVPGTVITKIKFAVFPTRVGNYYLWFRRYEVSYMYLVMSHQGVMDGKPVEVSIKQWLKVEERAL